MRKINRLKGLGRETHRAVGNHLPAACRFSKIDKKLRRVSGAETAAKAVSAPDGESLDGTEGAAMKRVTSCKASWIPARDPVEKRWETGGKAVGNGWGSGGLARIGPIRRLKLAVA